jgi:hypothetical protein
MTPFCYEPMVLGALERLPDPFPLCAHFAFPLLTAARTARTMLT